MRRAQLCQTDRKGKKQISHLQLVTQATFLLRKKSSSKRLAAGSFIAYDSYEDKRMAARVLHLRCVDFSCV